MSGKKTFKQKNPSKSAPRILSLGMSYGSLQSNSAVEPQVCLKVLEVEEVIHSELTPFVI